MRGPIRILLIVFLVLVVAAFGAAVYLRESLRHVGFLTESDVRLLVSEAQAARIAVLQGKGCVLKIDESSIGTGN
jgi:hypothetical protein